MGSRSVTIIVAAMLLFMVAWAIARPLLG